MVAAPAGHGGRAPRATSGVLPAYAGEANLGEKIAIVPNPVEEAPDFGQAVVAEPYRSGAAPRREASRHREDAAAARRHEQDLRRSEDPRCVFVAGHGVHTMHKSASTASLASSASSVGGHQSQYACSDTASMTSITLGAALPAELGSVGLPAVPECFRCPISQDIMEDPVCAEDGRTYERRNVASLGYSGDLRPNFALKEAIQGYLELRVDAERRQMNWQSHLAHQEHRVARRLAQKKLQVRGLRAALEQRRKRAEELSERKATIKSTASTTASSHEDGSSHCSAATPQSDRSPADDGACKGGSRPRSEEACYKSSPAPRGEEHSPANELSYKTGAAPRSEERSPANEPSYKTGPAPRSEAAPGAASKLRHPQRSAWSRLLSAGLRQA